MPTAPAQPRSDLDMNAFRQSLEGERARILDEINEISAQDATGGPAGELSELSDYDQHMADQATETFLREQDHAISIALRNSLEQIEAAMHKLDAGTYGYCDRCGAEIPAERLEILPHAIHCIQCASDISSRF